MKNLFIVYWNIRETSGNRMKAIIFQIKYIHILSFGIYFIWWSYLPTILKCLVSRIETSQNTVTFLIIEKKITIFCFRFCRNKIVSIMKLLLQSDIASENHFSNYRQINMSKNVWRIFEKIILDRVKFFEKHELFRSSQHGYLINKSTSTAIFELT